MLHAHREQLKQATRKLIHGLGGLEAAALHTSVGKSLLSEYQFSHAERTMPIGVVADLEVAAGDPVVTRTLARLAGCALVPQETVAPAPAAPVDLVVALATDLGRFAAAVQAMEADGHRSAAEIEECRRGMQGIIDAAGRAMEQLCALQAGGRRDAARPPLAAVRA